MCVYLLQQLQQQNLSLPQFVLVQPGHPIATPLQPAQVIISQTPQAQQSKEMPLVFHLRLLTYVSRSTRFNINMWHVLHTVGILQAQNLLNQLPQSQANLLSTQPTITLAPQVMGEAVLSLINCNSFKAALLSRLLNILNLRNYLFYSCCSQQLQPAQQQLLRFHPSPTVRHHPNG